MTVDDVKYRVYGCRRTPECPRAVLGEKVGEAEEK